MLEAMPSRLFTEWTQFMRLEPFGSLNDKLGPALVGMTVANANRSKKGRPFNLLDFLKIIVSPDDYESLREYDESNDGQEKPRSLFQFLKRVARRQRGKPE